MFIEIATATEMQNNFGKYLSLVLAGKEVIVTKNGKEDNLDDVKSERLREKYETLD